MFNGQIDCGPIESKASNGLSIDDLQRCLQSLAPAFATEREVRRRTDVLLSSEFNVFDYLVDRRSEKGELMLSQVLAMILDTEGEHGQGARFQSIFVEQIKSLLVSPAPAEPKGLFNCPDDGYSVTTELSIGKDTDNAAVNGRIDLMLTHKDGWFIGIENKPFAHDQYKQLERYLSYLESIETMGYGVVYLSGDGSSPSEISLSTDDINQNITRGQLCTMGYRKHFVPFLKECRDSCESPRFVNFLNDFVHYVDNRFPSAQGQN